MDHFTSTKGFLALPLEKRLCVSERDPSWNLSLAMKYTSQQCRAECLDRYAKEELGCSAGSSGRLQELLGGEEEGEMPACELSEGLLLDNWQKRKEELGDPKEPCSECLAPCERVAYDTSLVEDSFDPDFENHLYFDSTVVREKNFAKAFLKAYQTTTSTVFRDWINSLAIIARMENSVATYSRTWRTPATGLCLPS